MATFPFDKRQIRLEALDGIKQRPVTTAANAPLDMNGWGPAKNMPGRQTVGGAMSANPNIQGMKGLGDPYAVTIQGKPGFRNGGITGGMNIPNSSVPDYLLGDEPTDPRLAALEKPQPTGAMEMPPYANAPDISGMYSDIGRLIKGSSDAGLSNAKQQLYGQIPGVNQSFDALNAQAYTNARLSALGNNEALAAQGLAGNAYAGPQSGYSESSRVAQDAAMGNAINANNLARLNALQGIENQVGQATTAANAALLGQQGSLAQQQAQATQQESQFGRSLAETQAAREQQNNQWQQQFDYGKTQDAINNALNEAGITGIYNGQETLAAKQLTLQKALGEAELLGTYNGQKTMAALQMEYEKNQRAIENAMNKVNLMGKVDAETSKILGLPVGTPSWQANAWQKEFDLKKKR